MSGVRSTPRRRRWPAVLAGAAVCLVLAAALMLAPPFQTWLVRRVLAHPRGPWNLSLERVGVGPTGLNATGLNLSLPGVSATSSPFRIRVATTRLFSHRELSIERVEAQKIQVVLTPSELAPLSDKPFEGVLHLLQIPLRWQLDAAHIDGEILVREGGASRGTGHFSLRGGGLGPGAPGTFNYELTANSLILPVAPGNQFSSRGTIRVDQTSSHGIGRMELDGDLRLPPYGPFILPAGKVHATLEATPNGEVYAVRVSFENVASVELAATIDASQHQCIGRVTVHANQDVFASLLHERMPQLDVEGTANLKFDLLRGDWQLAVKEALKAERLDTIAAQLAPMKGVALAGNVSFEAEKHNGAITVKSFDGSIADGADARLRIVLARAVALSLWLSKPGAPRTGASPGAAERGAEDLVAQIELQQLPLTWLSGYAAASGVQIESGVAGGAWSLRLDPQGGIRVNATTPTTVSALRVTGASLPPLSELQLTFLPQVTKSGGDLTATLANIELTSSRGDYVRGNVTAHTSASSDGLSSEGQLAAAIPSLLANAHGPIPIAFTTQWEAAWAAPALQLDRFSLQVDDAEAKRGQSRGSADAPALGAVSEGPLQTGPAVNVELKRPIVLRVMEGSIKLDEPEVKTAQPQAAQKENGDFGLLVLSFNRTPLAWASPGALGSISGNVRLLDRAGAVATQLEFATSVVPAAGEKAQPVRGSLQGRFHPVTSRIVAADTFDLTLVGAGETATLTAPQPFIFGLSNGGSLVCSTLEPLKLHLDRLELEALKPWLPTMVVKGALGASDLLISAHTNHFTVEAARPFHLEELSVKRAGDALPMCSDDDITFSPHADLLFLSETKPVFQFAYQGQAGASQIGITESGHAVANADGQVGFKGNSEKVLVDTVDLTAQVHLGSLPHFERLGLPRTGELSLRAQGDLLGDKPLVVQTSLSDIVIEGRTLPRLTFSLEGNISSDLVLKGRARLDVATQPIKSDLRFDARLNLAEGNLNIVSGLASEFLDLSAMENYARVFSPPPLAHGARLPVQPPKSTAVANRKGNADTAKMTSVSRKTTPPFWGALRGSFDLDLARVDFAPYRISGVRGRLEADDRTLRLKELSGEMFSGVWRGDVAIAHEPDEVDGDHRLTANFDILQFDSARVVQTVFPNQLASVDAKIDVHTRVASHGNSFAALLSQSGVEFSVLGKSGTMHLAVPKSDMLSSAAVFGGTVLLSPELRALGRLIRKLAEMPMERMSITGTRDAAGEIALSEFVFDSPQMKLRGHGRVAQLAEEPLMNRPLELSLQLAAKDEIAVILNGMHLLVKTASPDGYRALRQSITIGGRTGSPDTTPLYDLLAQAVSGSHGTWGVLMRRLQADVNKQRK